MKRCILLFFLFPFAAYAQKKDTVLKYLDRSLQPTTKKNAVYAGVAIKQQGGWLLYGLYPDTTPVVKAWYKDKQLTNKNGPYAVFHPRNIPAQLGYYSDNKMNGVWQSWYPNGQKKDSGLVVNNQLVGPWKVWHSNGTLMYDYVYGKENPRHVFSLLPESHFGLRDGSFTSWYDSGALEATGFYRNDAMDGEWKWFHSNGKPSTIEHYKEGKLISLQCFDTTGKATGDFCSILKPAVLKGFGDYKQYIFQHLLWPEEALKKKIEGTVTVRFSVNKNGHLENLVIEGHAILKRVVEELFETMKEWYPAVSHNRSIEWSDQFNIPFYRRQ